MSFSAFHGDRPIRSACDDRFELASLAERIADAVTNQAGDRGFVLGIEGAWGSGKSSLLKLTIEELLKRPPHEVAVVDFKPWLVGDRDQLLTALFEDLIKALAALKAAGGDATDKTSLAAGDAAEKARRFARHLVPLSRIIEVSGHVIPGAALAGEAMGKLAGAIAERGEGPTLAEQKEELSRSIRKLNCRIVVAIDDVDRLEPKEVSELLRLVRSVADFPSVSYVLCYDARSLAQAVEQATGVKSGRSYLEKIIQTEVAVPKPKAFALRRWFLSEFREFVAVDQDRSPDLEYVISETGGRSFDTPRTVVRILDSLRLLWPGLRGRVDVPDLVWLRTIAVASPNLYRWIEDYLTEYVAWTSGRAHIPDHERAEFHSRLDAALLADGLSWDVHQHELERHLPGLNLDYTAKSGNQRVFTGTSKALHYQHARLKRLASPSHSRLYFTLIEQADSVTEHDVGVVLKTAAENVGSLQVMLLDMSKEKGDTGTTKFVVLIELLRHAENDELQSWPIENLVAAIINTIDDMETDDGDLFGYPQSWLTTKSLLKRFADAIPGSRWDPLIVRLFQTGQSITFLSYLLRDETFAHGLYGDRPRPDQALTRPETFEEVVKTMLARFSYGGIDQVSKPPMAATKLYAWSQAGGKDEIVRQVAERSADDDWFLDFVTKLFSVTSDSRGSSNSLSLDALANFFESPTDVIRRAKKIEKSTASLKAKSIVDAYRRSIEFHGGDPEEALIMWDENASQAEEKKL
jgi:hypothetical protein